MNTTKEIEKDYQEFWKPIICSADGNIDMGQLKKELFDFHVLIRNVSHVYCEITNSRISKPLTDPKIVIYEAEAVNQELIDEEIAEARREEREDIRDFIMTHGNIDDTLTYLNQKDKKDNNSEDTFNAPCLICKRVRTYINGGELCHKCCMDGVRQKPNKKKDNNS